MDIDLSNIFEDPQRRGPVTVVYLPSDVDDDLFVALGALADVQEIHTRSLTNPCEPRQVRLTDAAIERVKGLTKLRELDLSGSKITDAALRQLARFKHLECLDLDDTQITDAGLKSLKPLRGIQELSLSNTKITDAGLDELKDLSRVIVKT